jgi:hypothetical protein
MKRSAGVTAAAMVAMLGSGFMLLMAVVTGLGVLVARHLPQQNGIAPVGAAAAAVPILFYLALGGMRSRDGSRPAKVEAVVANFDDHFWRIHCGHLRSHRLVHVFHSHAGGAKLEFDGIGLVQRPNGYAGNLWHSGGDRGLVADFFQPEEYARAVCPGRFVRGAYSAANRRGGRGSAGRSSRAAGAARQHHGCRMSLFAGSSVASLCIDRPASDGVLRPFDLGKKRRGDGPTDVCADAVRRHRAFEVAAGSAHYRDLPHAIWDPEFTFFRSAAGRRRAFRRNDGIAPGSECFSDEHIPVNHEIFNVRGRGGLDRDFVDFVREQIRFSKRVIASRPCLLPVMIIEVVRTDRDASAA